MSRLRIIIIGAGIAGLTPALALRQQDHEVILLEKSCFLQDYGAAISIGPNTSNLLLHLGMDPENGGANLCDALVQYTIARAVKVKLDVEAK